MTSNELIVNEPRIGWYFDGLPDDVTPPTATMLLDDGREIVLTVPWRSASPTSQVERWFHGVATRFGDDPDRTRFTYEVPAQLSFVDVNGPVALVGCRAAGYRANIGAWSVGQGSVDVQITVLGTTSMRYDRVNGIRTVIPELAEWMGLTSVREHARRDTKGRVQRLDLTLSAPATISLASRLNLRVIPTWRVNRERYGPRHLHDEMYVESTSARPRLWEEHLAMHQSFRELLDVAAWESFGYKQVFAHRSDDPIRVMSGDAVGPRWCDVHTYAIRHARPSDTRPRYLFRFGDIGPRGYRRWLALRANFHRGVVPLLALLDVTPGHVETHLTQSSVGLEAIGYQLALDSGMSQRNANALPFERRLELIQSSLPVATVRSDWPARAAGPTPASNMRTAPYLTR